MKAFPQSRVVAAPRVPQHSYSMSSLKRFNIVTIIATILIIIPIINITFIATTILIINMTIILIMSMTTIPIINMTIILIRYPGLAGQAPGPPPASSQFYLARSESRY